VKKNTVKRKLVLAKETLAKLEAGNLKNVAGGTLDNSECLPCLSGIHCRTQNCI